jgi:hypothetical protein
LSEPRGRVLARVVPDGEIAATVIEREPGFLRVVIVEPNQAIGWVAESATQPAALRGGFGYGRGGYSRRILVCPTDVPLYVRSKSGRTVRVGHLKKNQPVVPAVDPTSGAAEIEIKLEGTLAPFMRASDVAACSY